MEPPDHATDDERRRVRAAVRRRVLEVRRASGGFALDDPGLRPQLAEMWAIERLNQQAREREQEERARQQGFQRGQVCAFLTEGHSRAAAARLAGLRPETVSRWVRADEAFAAQVRDAEKGRERKVGAHRGRPRKLTVELEASIVRLLRAGASRGHAAVAAGVSRQTFYTWLREVPSFRDAVAAAERVARST